MKTVKMFLLGIAEAIKLTFNKKQAQKEAEEFEKNGLPLCDGPEITDEESRSNYLELQKEYNVNVFTKWVFLGLCISTVGVGAYLIMNHSLLFMLPLAIIVPLYKLYDNRSEMAHFRYLFIQFLLKTEEELESAKKGI